MSEVFDAPLPPAIVLGFWIVVGLICLRGLFAIYRDVFGPVETDNITLKQACQVLATPRQVEGSDDWVAYEWRMVPAAAPREKGPAPTIGNEQPAG